MADPRTMRPSLSRPHHQDGPAPMPDVAPDPADLADETAEPDTAPLVAEAEAALGRASSLR